jgi:hypothetical protein
LKAVANPMPAVLHRLAAEAMPVTLFSPLKIAPPPIKPIPLDIDVDD